MYGLRSWRGARGIEQQKIECTRIGLDDGRIHGGDMPAASTAPRAEKNDIDEQVSLVCPAAIGGETGHG